MRTCVCMCVNACMCVLVSYKQFFIPIAILSIFIFPFLFQSLSQIRSICPFPYTGTKKRPSNQKSRTLHNDSEFSLQDIKQYVRLLLLVYCR